MSASVSSDEAAADSSRASSVTMSIQYNAESRFDVLWPRQTKARRESAWQFQHQFSGPAMTTVRQFARHRIGCSREHDRDDDLRISAP